MEHIISLFFKENTAAFHCSKKLQACIAVHKNFHLKNQVIASDIFFKSNYRIWKCYTKALRTTLPIYTKRYIICQLFLSRLKLYTVYTLPVAKHSIPKLTGASQDDATPSSILITPDKKEEGDVAHN